MFAFGSRKEYKGGDMFSASDIQKLIDTFPPPEPRPGKESLIRSYSGQSLVRSDAVVKRFRALLDSRSTPLLVSGLSRQLGVQDVSWLLEQEADRVFFTRDHSRILPAQQQRQVVDALRVPLSTSGVSMDVWPASRDVSEANVRRMMEQAGIRTTTLENGLVYSTDYLEDIQTRMLVAFREAHDSTIDVRSGLPHLPVAYLEQVGRGLLQDRNNGIAGILHCQADSLTFTPQSVIEERANHGKKARDEYIVDRARTLLDAGFCDVSVSNWPGAPEGDHTGDYDLKEQIKSKIGEENPDAETIYLQSSPESDPRIAFIIQNETLATLTVELAASAEQLASDLWAARQPGDSLTFENDTIKTLLKRSERPGLDRVIIESPEGQGIKASFDVQIAMLLRETDRELVSTFRDGLLCPFVLYKQGVESITDISLQTRVADFVLTWARKELVPEVLATIRARKVVTTKSALRDTDKLADAVSAAKNLEDIATATAKFARKQKVEQADVRSLADTKQTILAQKVAGMKRTKRASDLLQNLTWILLASVREGLYMSSGKDTSRMIKLYQAAADPDQGKRLGELRDLVKEGKETDAEKEEMREMARVAVERGAVPHVA